MGREARAPERVALDAGVDWKPSFLEPRVSATGDYLLLEEADDLAMEGRLNPAPRITRVGPEKGWPPPGRARSLPSHSRVEDVGLGLSPPVLRDERKAQPAVALRSLRGLVLTLETWKLE